MDLLKNPNYIKALEYIAANDLAAMAPGRYELDGENLFVNIVESTLKTPQAARLEVHDKYIDIQIPLSGPESYGVAKRSDCKEPDGEFNPVKDILFYKDAVKDILPAEPGSVVVFPPEIAHAPCIGEGTLKKAIFKVKVA